MITLPYATEIDEPLFVRDVQLHFFYNDLMLISFEFQGYRYVMYCEDQGMGFCPYLVEPNDDNGALPSANLNLHQLQNRLEDVYQAIAEYDLSFHNYINKYVDPTNKIGG
ncbi:hypothetical protein [Paenibacillus sp. NPDC057967]|uniref:hypothetical protein n=1 Tax=Paenibacillus sp. NPDC057967 TaxID=3346293 RepID=UPI0036DDDB2E